MQHHKIKTKSMHKQHSRAHHGGASHSMRDVGDVLYQSPSGAGRHSPDAAAAAFDTDRMGEIRSDEDEYGGGSDDGSDSDDRHSDMGGGGDSDGFPSSHFTAQLSAHIKSLAEECARRPHSTPFARLYAQAQHPRVKKKIRHILLRPDVQREKKVELIAGLLGALATQQQEDAHGDSHAAAASSSAHHG